MVQLTIRASATFRFVTPANPTSPRLSMSTTLMVRLFPAIPPTIGSEPVRVADRRAADAGQLCVRGIRNEPAGAHPAGAVQGRRRPVRQRGERKRQLVAVPHHVLPLPPTTAANEPHTLTIRAIDTFGTTGEISHADRRPAAAADRRSARSRRRRSSGAPTTSSITSWTRLEPQCTMPTSAPASSARVFDPLWMLTRQWQMGEFQA